MALYISFDDGSTIGELQELLADLSDLLQNGMRPGQAFHHLNTLFLSIFLMSKQPSQIFDFFLIIFHHNFFEILKEKFVIIRKLYIAEKLLQKLIVHWFLIWNFSK